METNNKRGIIRFLDKEYLHDVIFESDSLAGKRFDVALLVAILCSIVLVILDSVESIHLRFKTVLTVAEFVITFLFTLEYVLRIYCLNNRWKYIFSFYGLIDLLSILPTYLSILVPLARHLLVIRSFRLLRLFRIFSMGKYIREGSVLVRSLRRSAPKILVFILFISIVVVILGAIMCVVEGSVNESFKDIPHGIYWAVVTLTTVGYGDIIPQTFIGQFISVVVMLLGYAIIAVPTGIISADYVHTRHGSIIHKKACPGCGMDRHDESDNYCKYCGYKFHI